MDAGKIGAFYLELKGSREAEAGDGRLPHFIIPGRAKREAGIHNPCVRY